MQISRRFTLPIIAALTASLAACGADDNSSAGTSAAEQVPSESATLNAADIEFAQGMIAHHEQAVEMSEIALDPTVGASAEVTDLATRIQAAQEPEIDQMTAWLTAAGESLTMSTDDMSSMEGMMSADEMDALAASTGAEFDQMWLAMMIEHHEGAISQAEVVIAEGSNAEVLALAEQIIATQQGEIAEMRSLPGG